MTLPLAFRLARRELRGGLKGFRIFLVCLMLGVALIAAVGSVADSVRAGLARDAQALLGGDLEFRLIYRPATADERRFLAEAGEVSETREMRAMARPAHRDDRLLVELKAVDDAYPLFGSLRLAPEQTLSAALGRRAGLWGAAAEPQLLERLGLRPGDRVRVGRQDYELRAAIELEPDRGTDIFTLGPRLMVALPSLTGTGLEQPGSLVYSYYRLLLPPGAVAATVAEAANAAFPEAAWRVRGLDDAAPGVRRFIQRTQLFLTLVGLSALLVGGVGIGNAVRAYLEGKTTTIAILKCLGAPGSLVFRTYLSLIMLLASGGTAAGLVLGALAPLAASGLLAARFQFAPGFAIFPAPLLVAAAFGLLTALGFSLWPLARARAVPAANLFRDLVDRMRRRPGARDLAAMAAVATALAALAVATASDRMLAAGFVGGAVLVLALFRLAALLAIGLSRSLSRREGSRGRLWPALRLTLANLGRPGTPAGSVVLSLGIGLTVLVGVGLVQGNLERQITETLPESAPAFFFIDIQPGQVEGFDALVASLPGTGAVERVPMLRGRITAINDVPTDRLSPPREMAWLLQGDRGITWSASLPRGSRLAAGEWWPADYRGEPLISFERDAAEGLGIGIGDRVTVNVLGREIGGTIANLRDLEWGSLGINFIMVFSPGLLESAPQMHIATVHAAPEAEAGLMKTVTDRFANVSAIRVRDALASVQRILGAIGAAVGATGSVTLAAGILVLAGAVVAGHRRRIYDAVVLKVLGATRRDVAAAFLLEFGLLGLVTAALAALAGTAAAYFFVTRVMETEWAFLPGVVAATAGLSLAITLVAGFAGTWRALGQKAAPLLRNE